MGYLVVALVFTALGMLMAWNQVEQPKAVKDLFDRFFK